LRRLDQPSWPCKSVGKRHQFQSAGV